AGLYRDGMAEVVDRQIRDGLRGDGLLAGRGLGINGLGSLDLDLLDGLHDLARPEHDLDAGGLARVDLDGLDHFVEPDLLDGDLDRADRHAGNGERAVLAGLSAFLGAEHAGVRVGRGLPGLLEDLSGDLSGGARRLGRWGRRLSPCRLAEQATPYQHTPKEWEPLHIHLRRAVRRTAKSVDPDLGIE